MKDIKVKPAYFKQYKYVILILSISFILSILLKEYDVIILELVLLVVLGIPIYFLRDKDLELKGTTLFISNEREKYDLTDYDSFLIVKRPTGFRAIYVYKNMLDKNKVYHLSLVEDKFQIKLEIFLEYILENLKASNPSFTNNIDMGEEFENIYMSRQWSINSLIFFILSGVSLFALYLGIHVRSLYAILFMSVSSFGIVSLTILSWYYCKHPINVIVTRKRLKIILGIVLSMLLLMIIIGITFS